MTDNKNNQELLLLNQKLDFLTLSYISILDNAIKNIVHKIDKNLLIYEKKEEGDIFGTLNFIQNFKELTCNYLTK